jgi:hypothetical protein
LLNHEKLIVILVIIRNKNKERERERKNCHTLKFGSRDSLVGIATGYVQDGRGVGVRILLRARFIFLHVVQTGSGAHPAPYPMGIGGSFPEVKRPGREADHSPSTSAEVKNNCTWI